MEKKSPVNGGKRKKQEPKLMTGLFCYIRDRKNLI